MQQATVAQKTTTTEPSVAAAAAPASNAFVINLVSSTTPVALTRPDHAGLKRFTFFVSRRREEGRERFRLHMGYFDTQEDAEKLLDIVRGIYPGAWAGLAPGRRLASGRQAAAPAAEAAPIQVVRRSSPPAKASAPPAAPAAPSLPVEAVAEPAPTPRLAVPPRAAAAATAVRTARSSPLPLDAPTLALVPDSGRRIVADVTEVPESQTAVRSLSNVRAAIASLDDRAAAAPTLGPIPELAPAVVPTLQPPTRSKTSRRAAHDKESTLSDSDALRLLEQGTTSPAASKVAAAPRIARALEARTTTTQKARPEAPRAEAAGPEVPRAEAPRASERPEKPYYAVQLMWAVKPIDIAQVPQLAIFSAYTLYGAQGNRDGRRWYGLRLGFFTDAVSAKQVAHYVRADFSTVSIVPVTVREREQACQVARAAGPAASAAAAGAPSSTAPSKGAASAGAQAKSPEFEFIDDQQQLPQLVQSAPATRADARSRRGVTSRPEVAGQRALASIRTTRGAPGKRAKVRTAPGQIQARAAVKPKTLEETLEILGANQLQVDDEPGHIINDSGIGQMRVDGPSAKPSKLLRLFERLAQRIGD